jgi:cytochrome b561
LILWAAKQSVRPAHNPATVLLVRAGHSLLFAGMVLMPPTGISAMIGGGYGWSAFGMQIVPQGPEIPWMATLGSLHSPIAWTLLFLIAGHIGITLVHRFVWRDDVLKRMT